VLAVNSTPVTPLPNSSANQVNVVLSVAAPTISSSKFGWLIPQQVILSVAKDLDPGAPGRRFFVALSSDNAGSQ